MFSKLISPQLRIVALAAGFALTLVGILLLRRGSLVAGLVLISVGVAAYLWSSAQLQKQASNPEEELKAITKALPFAVVGFLSLASAFAVIYLMTDPEQSATKYYLADALWVVSILFLLFAVFWWQGVHWISREGLAAWWSGHRREMFILAAIFLAALLARVVDLTNHPYPWSGDEASIGLEGRRILNGEVTDFFDTGWSGQPNWSFLPTALSMRIFGENIIGIRMVSAMAGLLAVVFVYLLGKEMFNKQVGLLAAAFLAVYPIHVHFSRIGVNNINDSFMVVLVLWLVMRAARTGKLSDYVLAGVAAGLTMYTYVGTRLVLVLAIGALVYLAIARRDFVRTNAKGLALFLVAVIITAAPITYFFVNHRDIFLGRISQEGILFNGWLFSHAQQTGQSIFSVLSDQVSSSTLVFISQGATGLFYNSPYPYLTVFGAILFLLGMFYAITKLRHSPNVILLAWFWSVVLLGGVLTLNPPSNTRMVMTGPAVALFVAIGLWQLGQVLERVGISSSRRSLATLALVLFLTAEHVLFYFGEYRSNFYFADPNAELALEAGQELHELGPVYALRLLGAPRIFSTFPTLTFIAPDNEIANLSVEELETFMLPENRGVLFAAIPENMGALDVIEERFPGGTRQSVMRKAKNEVLYYAYILPPD